jgi:hypothetical protein
MALTSTPSDSLFRAHAVLKLLTGLHHHADFYFRHTSKVFEWKLPNYRIFLKKNTIVRKNYRLLTVYEQ